MRHLPPLLALSLLLASGAARAGTYYVAPSPAGNDATGDGSTAKPWATIGTALGKIPDDGSTILVRDGTYKGSVALSRAFGKPVTVKAEHPYRALLTNPGQTVVYSYLKGPARITLSGFEITNGAAASCTVRQNFLVHFQDVTDLTLEDNLIHDNAAAGNCNELIKLNSGSPNIAPRNIHIAGNLIYNPAPIEGADLIDCMGVEDVDIHDNIFFAKTSQQSSTSFVMIKSQKQFTDGHVPRSPRFRVYRNVLLQWAGAADQAFILFGEDTTATHQVTDSLIENNLLIGNSTTAIVAAFQMKGDKDIVIRANTVVGDLPGGSFALRAGTECDDTKVPPVCNPSVEGIKLLNNIWADPTGTMTPRFVNTYGNAVLSTFKLDRNLYWNGPTALTPSYFVGGSLSPKDDAHALFADPKLNGDQSNLVLPLWDAQKGAFASGSATIRDELVRLVETYGAIGPGSPAINAADPANMPADDILGRKRDADPDIGAYERPSTPTEAGGPARDGRAGGDSSREGGARSELGAAGDRGAAGEAPAPPPSSDGCGCTLGAAPAAGALALLVVPAILCWRRRRAR